MERQDFDGRPQTTRITCTILLAHYTLTSSSSTRSFYIGCTLSTRTSGDVEMYSSMRHITSKTPDRSTFMLPQYDDYSRCCRRPSPIQIDCPDPIRLP